MLAGLLSIPHEYYEAARTSMTMFRGRPAIFAHAIANFQGPASIGNGSQVSRQRLVTPHPDPCRTIYAHV
jgi:hypothetical protein